MVTIVKETAHEISPLSPDLRSHRMSAAEIANRAQEVRNRWSLAQRLERRSQAEQSLEDFAAFLFLNRAI